jgi:ABC-2 type transport system ATP-binding protein
VQQVLDLCGLGEVADEPAGQFSLGMGQRLGIASALLGDPPVLVLDEPVNGLDPDGIIWIRELLRSLADEGRTVLLSSHLMSEMAMTATDLVVIGRGALIAQTTVADVLDSAPGSGVTVRTPDEARLRQVLTAAGLTVSRDEQQPLPCSCRVPAPTRWAGWPLRTVSCCSSSAAGRPPSRRPTCS